MIEIRITGESLQDCLKQLEFELRKEPEKKVVREPEKKPEPEKKVVKEPEKKPEPVKAEEPAKAEEPVKEPEAPKEEEPKPKPEKKLSPAQIKKQEEQRKIEESSKAGPVEARQMCLEVKEKLGMDILKGLLAKFEVTKFRDVPEDQMPALHWEARHLLEVAGVAS